MAAWGTGAGNTQGDEGPTLDDSLNERAEVPAANQPKTISPPWTFFALTLLPFALGAGALAAASSKILYAMPIAYLFAIVPVCDIIAGRRLHRIFDRSRDVGGAVGPAGYRAALWCIAPALVGLLFLGFRVSAAASTPFAATLIGFVLGGAGGGVTFSAAHELLHSSSRADRALAALLLSTTCYGHWQLSHWEHHKKVGTTGDPATARRGESFYAFFPRCVFGNVMDAVRVSNERGTLVRNAVIASLGAAMWAALALCTAGARGLIAWGVYAFVAVVQLELVNYLEHYGLERREDERVREDHSWNAEGFFLTNGTTFNLQYHSHHHAQSSLPYEKLRSSEGARQLPAPYPAMMMLALFPRAWFKVVDPLLV